MITTLLISSSLILGTLPVLVGTRAEAVASPPSPASKKGADTAHPVAFEVDHAALLEKQRASTAEDTAYFIREGCTEALEQQHGVATAAAGAASSEGAGLPVIRVSLSWIEYVESIYRVEISTIRPGEEPQVLESFECECYDKELTAAIVERLPAALEQLEGEAPSEPVAATSEPVPEDVEPSQASEPTVNETDGAALGGLGIAGIVAAAAGVGMTGFGISRLMVGETDMVDSGDEELGRIRDLRPSGRAWLGAGLGTLAVGAAMLTIDLTLMKRRRDRAMSVVPSADPRWAGVVWSGRF